MKTIKCDKCGTESDGLTFEEVTLEGQSYDLCCEHSVEYKLLKDRLYEFRRKEIRKWFNNENPSNLLTS